jgi:uncharacterized NAD(P)/FAD-binding protein YdhS
LSRPHGRFLNDVDILDGEAIPTTALGLMRLLRRRVRRDGPSLGWQPLADAFRSKLPLLWGALPPREKARAIRRLLPFWEVHRFRIAPQLHAALLDDQKVGGLQVERGGLVGLERAGGVFVAAIRRPDGRRETRTFQGVVLCTGPEKDLRRNPLVASLVADGLIRLDDTRIGIAVDATSHALRPDGSAWPTLLAFGPMTRGSFGEMTGAPDISRHLERLAPGILENVPDRSPPDKAPDRRPG